MDLLKIILLLFGLAVIVGFSMQYLQSNKELVIEGFNSGCPEGEPCPHGCNKPTKIKGNCGSKIYKDNNGQCYKLCPYECTDPMAKCSYNECCDDCGKIKVYVDCQTGNELNNNVDLNNPTQESNYSASSINTGATDSSKNDIQGSVVNNEDYENEVAANTSQTSVQTSSQLPSQSQDATTQQAKTQQQTTKDNQDNNDTPTSTIEYHNHYYGLIPKDFVLNTQEEQQTNIPIVNNNTQQGTPNPYRQGGDISDKLDDQTSRINYGLSKKQDSSTVMNYGTYGSPKTSNAITSYETQQKTQPQPLTATGMYVENTTPGFNSLYSLHF